MNTFLLTAMLLIATPTNRPEDGILRRLVSHPGACVVLTQSPSRPAAWGTALHALEKRGDLKWIGDEPKPSEHFKDKFDKMGREDRRLLIAGHRNPFGAAGPWQWFRPENDRESRRVIMPENEASTINDAARRLAEAALAGTRTSTESANPEVSHPFARLSNASENSAAGCSYRITISKVDHWKDWAFVTTTIVLAPLNGVGETWALRKENNIWTIVAITQDWIS